jgi:putative spermidine/putrescine transport system ATP-binding protein
MSDRIAVMNRGAIEQLATPETIYRSPRTAFVLEFVGLSSRLAGKVVSALEGGMVAVDTAIGRIAGRGSFAAGSDVLVGVRPERIQVGQAADNVARVKLRDAIFQGSKVQLHFAGADSDQLLVETADLPGGLPAAGTSMQLGWSRADTLIYPAPRT